ncbi:MAG: PaaI family thioesterase [bacterium]
MKEVAKYSRCFVCGLENDSGLQARFFFDGRRALTSITADERFVGYHGIYHGGIISTLLDEVMIKAILAQDLFAVTAELTVRFLAPVRTGDEVDFSGWIVRRRGRLYVTEGEARLRTGSLVATAQAKYIEADSGLESELRSSVSD